MSDQEHQQNTPRKILGILLALSVPALLIASLWLWDWRWAATSLITGITSLFFFPQKQSKDIAPMWPPREDLH